MPIWKHDVVAPQTAGAVLGSNQPGKQQWLDMSTSTAIVVVLTGPVSSPQSHGAIALAGTVTPAGSIVEASQFVGGIRGPWKAMTPGAGTAWSGNLTCIAGTPTVIRVRAAQEPDVFVDSNPITIT